MQYRWASFCNSICVTNWYNSKIRIVTMYLEYMTCLLSKHHDRYPHCDVDESPCASMLMSVADIVSKHHFIFETQQGLTSQSCIMPTNGPRGETYSTTCLAIIIFYKCSYPSVRISSFQDLLWEWFSQRHDILLPKTTNENRDAILALVIQERICRLSERTAPQLLETLIASTTCPDTRTGC